MMPIGNKIHHLILLLITQVSLQVAGQQAASNSANPTSGNNHEAISSPPAPLTSSSYLSLDGLALVVVFDKPVNLSASLGRPDLQQALEPNKECPIPPEPITSASDEHQIGELVQGVQLCARLLTKRTLKLLHKHRLHNCLWASRIQFIVQLGRQVPLNSGPIRLGFQRQVLAAQSHQHEVATNEREVIVELNRLPLESLGVPLTPRLALTGPNQVPPCGLFTLSAHLSSPYGTQLGDSLAQLAWSVQRIGYVGLNGTTPTSAPASSTTTRQGESREMQELKWRSLEQLVANQKGNQLVLEARLLQFAPTHLYEFQVSVSFATPLAQVQLNVSHQVGRIDFETPIGTVYGSHLLQQQTQVNPSREMVLLADVQVPECVSKVKQVGLYWQVSDSRVKFEQTYAPFYWARPNSLPELANIEFRLNTFYGIRVKRYASSGTQISTGEPMLDSSISDGLLIMTIGGQVNGELELYATTESPLTDKFTYLWSCFDGKTGQPCRSSGSGHLSASAGTSHNSTRYELSTAYSARQLTAVAPDSQAPAVLLVDHHRQQLPILRLPLSWLEPDAQLWFGLQRYERQLPVANQKAHTEYTLVSVHSTTRSSSTAPVLSIGPVLVGRSRRRTTVRNPLTGAVVLVAGVPALIVGRLSPRHQVRSFTWRSANHIQPLHWTFRNSTNPLNGKPEIHSELHLNPNLQVPYGHHQIQLMACTESGATVEATLNLDLVPGVSQCKVRARLWPPDGPLLVSVEFCNIPLGLSPITYQIYMVLDDTNTASAGGLAEEDDYFNESDAEQLESRAQPMTSPQLTPVFIMEGFSARFLSILLGLKSTTSNSTSEATRTLRFAARVCDKLSNCRMFYSVPLGPNNLLSMATTNSTSQPMAEALLNKHQQTQSSATRATIGWLQSLLEVAERTNRAGNSVAAISVLNGAMGLDQKTDLLGEEHAQRFVRDTLHYGSQSIQRQFHFTDSGQTNVVTDAMARILSMQHSSLESKFKAMRLMAQLTKRTVQEQQVSAKMNCLADFRTIQTAFESLFGTFGHYHINSNLIEKLRNNSNTETTITSPPKSSLLSLPLSITSNLSQPSIVIPPLTAEKAHATRRKREEAILAYLKAIRIAYRWLLAAATIQLPLGVGQQFHYASPSLTTTTTTTTEAASASQTITARSRTQKAAPFKREAPSHQHSDIVGSLSHLTELSEELMDMDQFEFGSLTLKFAKQFVTKLRQQLDSNQLKCRNSTLQDSTCSSFVLSLTTFGGKAPFRALDEILRVPIVEVGLLSPLDGSNLLDYQQQMDTSDSYQIEVTFNSPQREDLTDETKISKLPKFKCYRFNEDLNEWIQTEVAAYVEPDSVRCTYYRPGVYAAFRSEPVPGSGSIKASVAAIVVGVLVAMGLITMLACLTSGDSSKSDDGSERSSQDDPGHSRHPEQTYRSDFNYPLNR